MSCGGLGNVCSCDRCDGLGSLLAILDTHFVATAAEVASANDLLSHYERNSIDAVQPL